MSTEENTGTTEEFPKGAKAIHPEGDYAIKGFVILGILENLRNTLPIVHSSAVNRVEQMLATVQPIIIQSPKETTQAVKENVQPGNSGEASGLVEGGA